jgi:hypothetical protein
MRFPAQFRMSITRRGEKAQRLTAFLAQGLAKAGADADPSQIGGISALARSLESPVARAIGTLAAGIAAAGCPVRLLLVRPDRLAPVGGSVYPQAAFDCEVRLARDPRLIEAHEQLVLGRRASWTGDSMRRDPAACDAYESFTEDCPDLAAALQSTFDRLWSAARPIFAHHPPLPTCTARIPLPLVGRG